MNKMLADGTLIMMPEKGKFVEGEVIKFDAPEREPGSIERRTDFNYMFGHGTFYKFVEEYFPENLLDAKRGDEISLVLYNLNTDQLDEVVFMEQSNFAVGESFRWIRGYIIGCEDCWAIKIRYNLEEPLDSSILVFASAPYL